MRLFACLLVLQIALWPEPISGAPKDVAELFPADSLAYLEMCKPGETAKDIAAFFKGSILENPLPTLDKMRTTNGAGIREAGLLTAFFGPEMLKEASRFHGIAVALTGFDKRGNPEVVEAMQGVVRFWIERGVDGFRLDAIDRLIKDAELRDDPPASREFPLPLREDAAKLDRIYSSNRPEVTTARSSVVSAPTRESRSPVRRRSYSRIGRRSR